MTNNGIWLMGLAAIATLWYTHGSVSSLLVMYAINVFVTFSLTLIGMTRHWIEERGRDAAWKKGLLLHGAGAVLCVGILAITIYEKAFEGGWMTIVVTALLVVARVPRSSGTTCACASSCAASTSSCSTSPSGRTSRSAARSGTTSPSP